MRKLAKLMKHFGATPDSVAEACGVTVREAERWAQGRGEPDSAALRDLAFLFGTSVRDLVNAAPDRLRTCLPVEPVPPYIDSLWGYLGLPLPGQTTMTWYPITADTARRIEWRLDEDNEVQHAWTVIETLNNRLLAYPTTAFPRFTLLSLVEAERTGVAGDSRWPPCAAEVYRVLHARFYDLAGLGAMPCSVRLQQTVDALVRDWSLDNPETRDALLRLARIVLRDGTVLHEEFDPEVSVDSVVDADSRCPSHLRLGTAEATSFYPAEHVQLVDMPLCRHEDAIDAMLDAVMTN